MTSDDPVYVQGDYNTVSKTLAMVAGDAITILSNDWSDANSSLSSSNYANRVVQKDTAINAVFMIGIS